MENIMAREVHVCSKQQMLETEHTLLSYITAGSCQTLQLTGKV